MTDTLIEIEGRRCLIANEDGLIVCDAKGARALVEEAIGMRASVIVVPVARLDPAFFQLRSGLAGEVVQKALNYRLKFAALGDVSPHVAASDALRDFVIESDRGSQILFVPDLPALGERLAAIHAALG